MTGGSIASPANPRVKELTRLHKRRERDRTGLFLVEGDREVTRALEGGISIEELFVCGAPVASWGDAPVTELSPEAFARVTYRKAAAGVVAVARQFDTGLGRIATPLAPLLLVVEAVEKPGNLGAMLRTAAAAGCDAVIVTDPATDIFNPNVVRASLGTLFLVPVAVADGATVREWLADRSIPWLAATVHGSRSYWSVDMAGPTAVVIGSEDRGLTEPWMADPERTIAIPATGPESLNAASAAALLLFEARRQRR